MSTSRVLTPLREARATELASTLNELMRSARRATRKRAFDIGVCVLVHPRSFRNLSLENFDAFQGDDGAGVMWVTAKPEEQASLAELIQRLDRE
jgi:hypothetical protein